MTGQVGDHAPCSRLGYTAGVDEANDFLAAEEGV